MIGDASKPKLDLYRSYIAMIENSVGANLFRNLYFYVDGKSVDVLEDGDLSCAVYVTTILYTFGLIKERHATVNGTIEDIEKSGWYKINEPRKGTLILWGFKKKDDGTPGKHRHVGFYIDENTAISNDSDSRVVWRHHPTYGKLPSGETRCDVQAYYWNERLNH